MPGIETIRFCGEIALTPVKFGISFNKTMLNQAGALVHIYTDGTIHLNHGGTEMGRGGAKSPRFAVMLAFR